MRGCHDRADGSGIAGTANQADLRRLGVEDIPHADGQIELLADLLGNRGVVIPGRRHFDGHTIMSSNRNGRRVSVAIQVERFDAQAAGVGAVVSAELLFVARAAEDLRSPEERPPARRPPCQPEVADPFPRARAGRIVDVDDAIPK